MSLFSYFGRNRRNVSSVSWKIWKIERKGRRVTTWFRPATLFRRKPVPVATLQSRSWVFPTEAAAKGDEARRIAEKLGRGYERKPRRR